MRQRDERVVIRSTRANTRRVPTDAYYEYGQKCVEYLALMFGNGTRLNAKPKEKPSPTFPPDPLSWMSR